MRRALCAIACATAGVAAVPAEAAAPSRMLVTAREFTLTSSRQALPAGKAIVQLVNGGEDVHDLAFRRYDGHGHLTGRTLRFPDTSSGKLSQKTLKLKAGRWRLWCTLPGHEQLGMRATLRVRKR